MVNAHAPMTAITDYVADVSGWEDWKRDFRFGVLLIIPPDPPLSAVNALRARYAWSQGSECDAHISITVPLPRALCPSDWAELEAIAGAIEPIRMQYGPLRDYLPAAGGVVLRIEPQDRLAHLLAELESAPCFTGARPRPYPFSAHMTIAEILSVDQTLALMEELREEAPQGTFVCDHVSYAVPDAGFRFTERAKLQLLGQSARGMGRDR